MKRSARFLAILLLILLLVPVAHADVLWEPENTFYKTHSKDCTVLRRSFYANGPEGYVTVWTAPESNSYVGQYENGTQIHAWWQYENWVSATFIQENGKRTDGWVCLDELALIYDYISFQEEYGNKITPYDGEFTIPDEDVQSIDFYPYPGAPQPTGSLDKKVHWTSYENFVKAAAAEDSFISSVFTDEEGHAWGYITYWQGNRNTWFCLDEPDGENFPVREVSKVELISVEKKPEVSDPPAAVTEIPVVQQNDTKSLTPPADPVPPATALSFTPYLLVGGVVLITAALLFLLARQRKKSPKN